MRVKIGKQVAKIISKLSDDDKEKIRQFIQHVEQNGFEGLAGRNKSSDQVPKGTPNKSNKIKYAQEHNLWHYHIGIPEYIDDGKKKGDKTSQYLIHYIKGDGLIKIVDFSSHPPFKLPETETME
ncbi:MAG: hypothetical protein IKX14_05990 [Neisseriaceae bacterium]|nr:hypothetical protein [Neisseriaceae bacterium]